MITHALLLDDMKKGFDLIHFGESIRAVSEFRLALDHGSNSN